MYPRFFSAFVAASSVLQIAVATTVPIVSCSVSQPQLLTNPSFEGGSLDGWRVTSNNANPTVVDSKSSSSPFSTAADGKYYLETYNSAYRGGDALFLSQTVDGLNTSMTYTITYSIAGLPHGATGQSCYVYVFKDSQTNDNLLVQNIIPMGANGLPWTQYSIDFTPTGSSHLILFLSECYQTQYLVGFDSFQFLEPATTACSTSYSTVAATASSSQAVILASSTPSGLSSTSAIRTPTPSPASFSNSVSSSAAVTSGASSTSPIASPSVTPRPSSSAVSSQAASTTTDVPEPDEDDDDGCPAW
ncbi:hypothetical protein PMAA_087040 [Talaromyces marneffei ATCC 18224]|uniref:CBM-cenC domain-containing protein n=1 Tax=Talaromyces marneffei (strain ATCC 18224 / CBS 334.59 / QM 7333) TaxID=441960 RepID=B6QD26_TALMQ|nr:hypothetical protein PMAA_087040 [Talaromyces marneffei ATCC 18224]